MKRFFSFKALVFLAGMTGLALAQNKPMVASPTPLLPSSSRGKISTTSPNAHSVNLQVRAQMQQIQKDLKSGKLTKDQAKSAFSNLKAMRQQEIKYFHQNGQKEITPDQKNQMEKTLSVNAGSI